jgi:hypothetical protein
MSTQFKPKQKTEREYDKRAYLMRRGIIERLPNLAANSGDLKDLDVELAKEGEQ